MVMVIYKKKIKYSKNNENIHTLKHSLLGHFGGGRVLDLIDMVIRISYWILLTLTRSSEPEYGFGSEQGSISSGLLSPA